MKLTKDLAIQAEKHQYITGKLIGKRFQGSKDDETLAGAMKGALAMMTRSEVTKGEITTPRAFLEELETAKRKIEDWVKPLDI